MKIQIKIILGILLVLLTLSIVSASEIPDGAVIHVSMLNQDPNPAKLGDIVEVRFSVSNLGLTPVNNLNISFEPKYFS